MEEMCDEELYSVVAVLVLVPAVTHRDFLGAGAPVTVTGCPALLPNPGADRLTEILKLSLGGIMLERRGEERTMWPHQTRPHQI